MKRIITTCLIVCCQASVASAGITVKLFDGYGGGFGGEFDVRIMPESDPMDQSFSLDVPLYTRTSYDPMNAGARQFAAFCLERDENITYNTTYNATISDEAFLGGYNTNSGDPISPQTAYLYSQFALGLLSDYDYGEVDGAANSARISDASALQRVIWWFENEIDPGGRLTFDDYDPFDMALAQANLVGQSYLWWLEAMNSGWTDIGNVRVMNLWDVNTGAPKQSQLMLTSYVIPAPGAAVLGCIGLSAVGLIRRRRLG